MRRATQIALVCIASLLALSLTVVAQVTTNPSVTGTVDLRSPGAIGSINPSTGAFTTLQSTTAVDSLTQGVAQFKSGSWTPSPTSLTVVGTPTYTGTYTRIGDRVFCVLQIVSTTSTASSAGTTYFSGLPYAVAERSVASAVEDSVASLGNGLVITTGSRIYTPAWGATSNIITVSFSYRTTANF